MAETLSWRLAEGYSLAMVRGVMVVEKKQRLAVAAGGAGGAGGGGGGSVVMTPALRQALRLLQLSRLELIEEIRRELDANTASGG